eukprot:8990760-Alexandrium_andersonii.AAC.1
MVTSAVTQARETKKSTSTGKKLRPSVLRVVRALGNAPTPSPTKRKKVLAKHDSVVSVNSVVSVESDDRPSKEKAYGNI